MSYSLLDTLDGQFLYGFIETGLAHIGVLLQKGIKVIPGKGQAPEPTPPKELVWKKDGASMLLIPAGEFQMGTDSAEIPQLVQWAKNMNLKKLRIWGVFLMSFQGVSNAIS